MILTNTTRGKSGLLNNANATANSYNDGYNGNLDMLYRHRFQKKGRTFSLDVNGSGNSNNGNGTNYSLTDYYNNGIDSLHLINQHYISKINNKGISTTAEYTEPVGKNSQLELDYNYNYNNNTADKTTYDFDSTTQKFTSINSLLTNQYKNTYSSNRLTLNYRIKSDIMNLRIQKERMNSGWRYQFIARDSAIESGRFKTILDIGAAEADFNAILLAKTGQGQINIYVSVKKQSKYCWRSGFS